MLCNRLVCVMRFILYCVVHSNEHAVLWALFVSCDICHILVCVVLSEVISEILSISVRECNLYYHQPQ